MSKRPGLRQRCMAWGLAHCGGIYEPWVADRKRRLFADVRGEVLELGPGTGANLAYLDRAARWIGLEPNRAMFPELEAEALRRARSIELLAGSAEGIPLHDASVDLVVATLLLCSVREPMRVLSEVRRVLRPGGRYLFIEHVAAERGTRRRGVQRFVRGPSRFLLDGCEPDRETWRSIEAAGFASLELEHFEVPEYIHGPHIAGIARIA